MWKGRAGLTRPAPTFYNAVMRIWILCFVLLGTLEAGGTVGYTYLQIPVSVDEALLGIGLGALPGPTSLRVNPAAWPTARTASLQGISYLAGVQGLGVFYVPSQDWALSLYGWNSGRMTRTDTLGRELGDFSTTHSALSGYYHRPFLGRGTLGIALSLYYQGIAEYNAVAAGMDVGVLYPLAEKPVTLGAAIRHVGVELKSMAHQRSNPGPELNLMGAWRFPTVQLAAGIAWTPGNATFTLGTLWQVSSLLTVGLGFSSKGLEANVGRERDFLNGWSAGFKLHHRKLVFGYAYTPLGELGDIHRISLELTPF